MKPKLFIIAGWNDTTGRYPYQRIADIAARKGYEVKKINPDWYEPLSKQLIETTKNDVVFGYSMGAILACMSGQKYLHKKMILASMTPVLNLTRPTLNILGKNIRKDLRDFKYGGVKAIYLYGEREVDESLGDIMKLNFKTIPNTYHNLCENYILAIANELDIHI